MVFLFVGILVLFMFYLNKLNLAQTQSAIAPLEYFPEPENGIVYHKPHFSLSYVERFEIPEWVTYTLTAEMMNKPKHERDQDFNPDPSIASASGHYRDYKSSGYRRGHLVPSADMAWNKEAMDATFLLSNVAPMLEEFNDGVWLDLEHNVRDWSRQYQNITVLEGPIFANPITSIGENEILVPRYFYKAVFTIQDGEPQVIGFIFDQSIQTYKSLAESVVPIDSIENVTGIDLFSNLYGQWDKEIILEKRNEITHGEWPFRQ